MKKIPSTQDPAITKMKYTVEANSPYNDGWTREAYKKELTKIERKEKIKNIIYITFIILVPITIWMAIFLMSK